MTPLWRELGPQWWVDLKADGGKMMPQDLQFAPTPKRLLIVYSPQAFERDLIVNLGEMLMRNGFHIWSMPTYNADAPDIRLFDLDGAPAPDTGLIQQLLASIVDKRTPVVVNDEISCPECDGTGQVATDSADCLLCCGTGRKKDSTSAGS